MRRVFGVGVVLLAFALFAPSDASAQQTGGERPKVRLEPPYPNPFNPTVRLPFVLPPALFEDGKPVVVSMSIRDVEGRLIAIPAALRHPEGDVEVKNLEYATPGKHEAFWNGEDKYGRKVASAIYFLETIVNGERAPIQKLVVAK